MTEKSHDELEDPNLRSDMGLSSQQIPITSQVPVAQAMTAPRPTLLAT